MNQLAKLLLPLLTIALTIPTLSGVAQAQSDRHHGHHEIADGRMGRMNDLNLSAEQKTKMEQLRASTRAQIDRVLTPEQRQKFQQIASQDLPKGQGRGLNFSADQKQQLQALRQNQQQQFVAILTPAQQAQLKQERGNRERGGWMARLDKLNLTSDQKAKLEQLKANTRNQMEAILTPEQRQKSQTMLDRRAEMAKTWDSINLTADQKAKIKAIRQASAQQIQAILTPEQQSKLKSKLHGNRPHL